jgi:xylulokinase
MYLGIDVGTSGVKAILMDAGGAIVGAAESPLAVTRTREGWSEQSPGDWWIAVEQAVGALDAASRKKVMAVGLAGQMHGATLLGSDDQPLRDAILWNDTRSFAECLDLESAEPRSRQITGNIAMPGFTEPKLLWVRKHEPRIFDEIGSVLLPKDYIRLLMTGDKASDLSDSAGTLWLDVGARTWSGPMLAASGLSRDQMPRLFDGCEVTGTLRREVAAKWGMDQVPVAAGAGDNAAAAAGAGVIADGDALLSLGTSGVIFAATAAFRPNPERAVHTFCHCLPDMWHQMSVHLSAASCIDWGGFVTGIGSPAAFFAHAELAGPAAGPELFLPYLSGERTPHNDPHVRGAFLGLDFDTSPGRLASAVLEGVAFAHADGLDALRQAGTQPDELAVVGGGARSRYWGTILASVLNARLVYHEGAEVGASIGAARLAQMAVTGANAADVCVRPQISHTIEPDAKLAERLAAKRDLFKAASVAVRSLKGI